MLLARFRRSLCLRVPPLELPRGVVSGCDCHAGRRPCGRLTGGGPPFSTGLLSGRYTHPPSPRWCLLGSRPDSHGKASAAGGATHTASLAASPSPSSRYLPAPRCSCCCCRSTARSDVERSLNQLSAYYPTRSEIYIRVCEPDEEHVVALLNEVRRHWYGPNFDDDTVTLTQS